MKGSINTFINIVIELKKCCNHALLTKPEDYESRASLATTDAVEVIHVLYTEKQSNLIW